MFNPRACFIRGFTIPMPLLLILASLLSGSGARPEISGHVYGCKVASSSVGL